MNPKSDRRDYLRAVKVIEVICTTELSGSGREGSPCREVTKYWSLKGELLAEHDPAAGL
jgi:hypothetical protein